jgi:hypothetical protein
LEDDSRMSFAKTVRCLQLVVECMQADKKTTIADSILAMHSAVRARAGVDPDRPTSLVVLARAIKVLDRLKPTAIADKIKMEVGACTFMLQTKAAVAFEQIKLGHKPVIDDLTEKCAHIVDSEKRIWQNQKDEVTDWLGFCDLAEATLLQIDEPAMKKALDEIVGAEEKYKELHASIGVADTWAEAESLITTTKVLLLEYSLCNLFMKNKDMDKASLRGHTRKFMDSMRAQGFEGTQVLAKLLRDRMQAAMRLRSLD